VYATAVSENTIPRTSAAVVTPLGAERAADPGFAVLERLKACEYDDRDT
jgi:hypothetical protein